MPSNQSRLLSAPACIETLESRRFLSASPLPHTAIALVQTPAVKVKAAVPVITGAPFIGTFKLADIQGALTIVISSETTKGALHATVSGPAVFTCTGTVKSNGKVALHGKSGKVSLALSGTLNATHTTLSGKFIAKGKKAVSGTYTASTLVV